MTTFYRAIMVHMPDDEPGQQQVLCERIDGSWHLDCTMAETKRYASRADAEGKGYMALAVDNDAFKRGE